MDKDKKIAVLIDADNVSDKYIKYIIDEISNHGIPTYKRIYGDWTKPQLASWKNVLLNYSISPIQQYNYTTGKNSTDAALIIDAMDILYSKMLMAFVLYQVIVILQDLQQDLEKQVCMLLVWEKRRHQHLLLQLVKNLSILKY